MDKDSSFTGSIPETYERAMVPLLFTPYALDMARRVAQQRPQRILEVAAGRVPANVVNREAADHPRLREKLRRLGAGEGEP